MVTLSASDPTKPKLIVSKPAAKNGGRGFTQHVGITRTDAAVAKTAAISGSRIVRDMRRPSSLEKLFLSMRGAIYASSVPEVSRPEKITLFPKWGESHVEML